MVETLLSFSNLPEDFQEVIRLGEERHDIAVAPLQELGGGRSGAAVYLVRVTRAGSAEPEHLILKLDRKNPKSTSDEISRHLAVENDSPPQFARSHIPTLALDRVEADGALAIFYSIAGQPLRRFRTLSSFS